MQNAEQKEHAEYEQLVKDIAVTCGKYTSLPKVKILNALLVIGANLVVQSNPKDHLDYKAPRGFRQIIETVRKQQKAVIDAAAKHPQQ